MSKAASKLDEYDRHVQSNRVANTTPMSKKLGCFSLFSKKSLLVLNVIFLIFAIIVIAVGSYVVQSAVSAITTQGVPVGMIVMGTFLLVISIFGCIAAAKESRKLLGIYAVLLFLILLVQIIIAIVLLTNSKKADDYVRDGWAGASASQQADLQDSFGCCGLTNYNETLSPQTCKAENKNTPCLSKISSKFEDNYVALGAIALTFGILQAFGVILALCLRGGVGQTTYDEQQDERSGRKF